jgi:hypothetical protein
MQQWHNDGWPAHEPPYSKLEISLVASTLEDDFLKFLLVFALSLIIHYKPCSVFRSRRKMMIGFLTVLSFFFAIVTAGTGWQNVSRFEFQTVTAQNDMSLVACKSYFYLSQASRVTFTSVKY